MFSINIIMWHVYGQVELVVEVLDENDESPTFTQPFGYTLVTSEGESIGEVLSINVSLPNNLLRTDLKCTLFID